MRGHTRRAVLATTVTAVVVGALAVTTQTSFEASDPTVSASLPAAGVTARLHEPTAAATRRYARARRATRGTLAPAQRRLARQQPHTTSITLTLASDGRVPNDPLYGSAWSLGTIHAADAWATSVGDPGVVIAVLDTGIDPGQPDLQGALVPGADFVNRDDSPDDDFGHGTMVAGVVAARGDNGIGAAGVCWQCSLMPVKVIGADGRGTSVDIADGIRYAADHGADVVNMSFVLDANDQSVADAVAYAQQRGVIVVAAAGNSGSTNPLYPAALPGVIGVGGTTDADAPYPWSSTGPWVAVTAPGCGPTTVRGGGYAVFCGTSESTAVVSGLAGVALAADPSATAARISEAITRGATGPNPASAAGRVDAGRTIELLVG